MPHMRTLAMFPVYVALALWTIGCGEPTPPAPAPTNPAGGTAKVDAHGDHEHGDHDHGHEHAKEGGHGHHHAEHGPHKGTLVMFGHEELHLELVLDSKTGTLTAYPLDSEAVKPVALDQETIELSFTPRVEGTPETLPEPTPLTLKKAEGDEEKYVGQSDALKDMTKFDAGFPSIKVKGGEEFKDTTTKFPEGNHVH